MLPGRRTCHVQGVQSWHIIAVLMQALHHCGVFRLSMKQDHIIHRPGLQIWRETVLVHVRTLTFVSKRNNSTLSQLIAAGVAQTE